MLKESIFRLLQYLLRNNVYVVRNGLAKGLKRRGGLGFFPQLGSLTREEQYLMDLNLNGKTVYDIGGYKGITTIYFASAVGDKGKVVTFEPNPENYSFIQENVRLNEFNSVEVCQIALGKKRETAKLAFLKSESGIGSIEKDIKSRILSEEDGVIIDVEVDCLDNQIKSRNLPKPDFIKIDVEGLEYDVLLGMTETIKKFAPAFFIEMHGATIENKIENSKKAVDFFIEKGYKIYHVESDEIITHSNAEVAKSGHINCTKTDQAK